MSAKELIKQTHIIDRPLYGTIKWHMQQSEAKTPSKESAVHH